MPSDAVLIVITLISCTFTVIVLKLMNQQWFQRLDAKYKHEKALAKLRKRGVSVKTPAPSSPMEWIEKLRGINPDVLHTLIDTIGGDEAMEALEGGGGVVETALDLARKNPELAKSFFDGLVKGGKGGEKQIESQV